MSMKRLLNDNKLLQIVMDDPASDSILDCFFDPEKNSDLFDNFFNNLDDASQYGDELQAYGNEQMR